MELKVSKEHRGLKALKALKELKELLEPLDPQEVLLGLQVARVLLLGQC
jgi:hypothetical protein